MDDFELAKALFKQPKDTKTARIVSGTAYADSADGSVQVSIDGSVVTLPTNVSVKDGDTVQVTLSDRSPVVTGVIGRGDEMQAQIDAVADVSNYFWHDNLGAHVSNIDHDTSGNNILIDADSVDIKDGADVLASFEANTLSLGKNSQTADILMCNELGKIHYEQVKPDPGDVSTWEGYFIMEPNGGVRHVEGVIRAEGSYSNKGEVSAGHDRYDSFASITADSPNASATVMVEQEQDSNSYALISADKLKLQLNDAIRLNGSDGTAGQVLTSQGTGAAPIWSTPSGGGVTFDTIYDTPLYYFSSGDIDGTIDTVPYDPARQGRAYNELDAAITDYDLLIVCFDWGTSSGAQNLTNGQMTMLLPVSSIPYGTSAEIIGGQKAYEFRYAYPASSLSWYIDVSMGFLDATHIYAHRRTYSNLPYWNIYKIYGIKF